MTSDIVPGWILVIIAGGLAAMLIGGALLIRWMRRWPERQYHRRYVRSRQPTKED